MARFQLIRQKYRVPLKRGMTVRDSRRHVEGVVTGSPRAAGQYINMRTSDGKVRSYHPYGLDYLVDGEWLLGDDMKREYDAAWDRYNKLLNSSCMHPGCTKKADYIIGNEALCAYHSPHLPISTDY